MADSKNDQQNSAPFPNQDAWKAIWENKTVLATELNRVSSDLPKSQRKRYLSLGAWFENSNDVRDVFKRSDVLEICLPILESNDDKEIDASQFASAARNSLDSMANRRSGSRELIQLLYYPLLVMLGCAVLAVGYSFVVAPEFESMFEEFGIDLPILTDVFLTASKFVRTIWWALFVVPFAGICLIAILDQSGRKSRPANLSWLDVKLMSMRNAFGDWAWHVALLLRAGLTQPEATEIAASVSGNSQLRYWVAKHIADTQFSNPREQHAEPLSFKQPVVQLLDCALKQPTRERKIGLLTETAHYYWDKNRIVGSWWIHWMIAATIWSIGAVVLLGIAALFMPLFSIIGGLM